MPTGRVAIVVGGTGVAACELAPHLLDDFTGDAAFDKVAVLALGIDEKTFEGRSIRPVTPLKGANLNSKDSIVKSMRDAGIDEGTELYCWWSLDANRPPKLGNPILVRHALNVAGKMKKVTHAIVDNLPKKLSDKFFGGLHWAAGSGSQPRNIEWLTNMMEAIEEVGVPLQCFTLSVGAKHYGLHLGDNVWSGFESNFEEDVHKCPGPLSYFEMEDFIKGRASEKGFNWVVTRPTFILGRSPEKTNTTQSFGLLLGVYANILKAQGKPLIYPGGFDSFQAQTQFTTSKQIARISAWASTASAAGLRHVRAKRQSSRGYADPDPADVQNQAFNCVSTPSFCWADVWDGIAEYFGMEGEGPSSSAGQLAMDVMGGEIEAEKTWNKLKRDYGLQDLPFKTVMNVDFWDKTFSPTWSGILSTKKIKAAGFPKSLITPDEPVAMFAEFLDELASENIIPNGDADHRSESSGSSAAIDE